MPGIVGLITRMPRPCAERQLQHMLSTLRHESFYDSGTWSDEALGVYVGWVARRGSFSEGMPLQNEGGDLHLVFSGEEFPEPGLRRRLEARGHALDADGPSYLVHAAEEDPAFPASLNGRFQGLLIDRRQQRATLFNDRWGMHRVYYHDSNEAFYFAAEAKAILAVRPELRVPDQQGLGELVACGCVLENRTVFTGISVLPPGSAWVFLPDGRSRKNSYFDPKEWEGQPTLDAEQYYQTLRDAFSRNLPRYFGGGQRVGMSLTGGLDTRMIMAWDTSPPGTLPCYSFGDMSRDCQDVKLARQIARLRRQPHEVIPVGDEFLGKFAHYAERSMFLTDGCTGVDRAPDLYVNERARAIAPVRMTGNYGGEVLRRVRAFKAVRPPAGLFDGELMRQVDRAAGTYRAQLSGHPLSFAVFRQAPWHHYGVLALEETQLALRSPFLDNDFVRTVFQAPASACVSNETSLRLIADGNPALMSIRTDRGVGGRQLLPAVSRWLLEFTFKAEYAYDSGMPQWVARIDHVLSPLRLERLFLGRHKFTHFRIWYRRQLSAYVRALLLDPKSLARPYVQRAAVEGAVTEHLRGTGNHTDTIHQLLTLEILHRLFFDAPVSGPALSGA